MKTGRYAPRAGFTLLEMMIVLAILGILVGLAFPNYLKSRTQARKQLCIENLSQIESAKQIWGVEHGKKDGDVPAQEEIVGTGLYMKKCRFVLRAAFMILKPWEASPLALYRVTPCKALFNRN